MPDDDPIRPHRMVEIHHVEERAYPCLPVRIYMLGGKLVNGCQRVPKIPVPEDQRHRVSYGAHVVREKRPITISLAQAQAYGRRGAAASHGRGKT